MRKLLIVDGDKVSLNLFPRLFKPHSESFEVLTAKNGKEAVEIVCENEIDLVLTELDMPEMNGYELLAYMSDNFQSIPVFIMTTASTLNLEERVKDLGAARYFEKPIDIDFLLEGILEELDADDKSQIWGITLPSFMQLMEMEGKTCTLTVKSGNEVGQLYFQKGELYSAETDKLKNQEAAFQMLTWNNTVIDVENINRKKKKEIDIPLMNILMEGLKLKDEADQKIPEISVFINKQNVAKLKCPKCSHAYSAILKRKK